MSVSEKKLPKDVYAIATAALYGYERRKLEYAETLADLRNTIGAVRTDNPKVYGGQDMFSLENATERILAYEESQNAKYIKAVETAKERILEWKYSIKEASAIFRAICLNALDPFRHTYNIMNKKTNLYVSRRTFYRDKSEMLNIIARELKLI
jgi:hypothetical protein